jgi:hypothetical protein
VSRLRRIFSFRKHPCGGDTGTPTQTAGQQGTGRTLHNNSAAGAEQGASCEGESYELMTPEYGVAAHTSINTGCISAVKT